MVWNVFILFMLSCLFAEDCILIDGQSNAATTYQSYNFLSDSVLSIASATNDSVSLIADSVTGLAAGSPTYIQRGVGAWGSRLGQRIYSVGQRKLFIVNGAVGGSTILQCAPSKSLSTHYGRLYYRVNRVGQTANVKYVYWWQGESEDSASSLLYLDRFTSLYTSWKSDYPNIQRVFIVGIRLGCTASTDTSIINVLKDIPNHFADVSYISPDNFPGWDGCHYSASGYVAIADTLFNKLQSICNYPVAPPADTTKRIRTRNYLINGLWMLFHGPLLPVGM